MDGYTQRLGFDVLTAPLAVVDPRGLSQAWFNALRLGLEEPSAGPPRAHGVRSNVVRLRQHATPVHTANPDREATPRVSSHARRSAPVATPAGGPRLTARDPLARKIERAFSEQRRARHASFVLDDLRGRVHVVIRTHGARVRLIAVCNPNARERVARALDEVKHSLARRAMELDACLRERIR